MEKLNKYGEIEDAACSECGKPIKIEWVACPHCGVTLKELVKAKKPRKKKSTKKKASATVYCPVLDTDVTIEAGKVLCSYLRPNGFCGKRSWGKIVFGQGRYSPCGIYIGIVS